MVEQRLDGLKVAILVTDNFEQIELTEPRKALDQAGAQTLILSPHLGNVHGFNHDRPGDEFKVDLAIDEANSNDFDAVLLPGGALNADKLRMEPAAQQFVQNMDQAGKPFAVICHAPWLLVSSGLVRGRTMTSYYTLQDDIRNAGGTWQDRAVVRDNNWVTSRQPKDIPVFNQAMLDLFGESVGIQQHHEESVMGAGHGERNQPNSGEPGDGKGRVDRVGGSGVYPASAGNAPKDAQAHGEASWGQGDRGAAGYEDHGSSELHPGPDSEENQ